MKKNIIAAALVASAVMSTSALAYDGTVNFNGNVTDQVCEVDMGGNSAYNVEMGTVGVNAFPVAGSLTTGRDFNIVLKNCPDSVAQNGGVAISFDGTPKDNNNAILDLTGSTATGVGVQISDRTNTVVNLRQNTAKYPIQATPAVNNLKFTARYISTTASVTAGTANAVSQFTIDYK